jgi:polyisoprenoid-binding protein YceI
MDTPHSVFRLDAGNTRVAFSVRWFGVVFVRGSFADVSGTLEVPGSQGDDASLAMQVDSHSVQTGIGLRDRHLRGLRFLDSARHPTIRFVSTGVSRHNGVWDVTGRLSLRGQERDVFVSVRDEAVSTLQRKLTAEFSVPRRPHSIGTAAGIRRLNPLLWAIGDEVNLSLEVLVPATMLAAEHAPAR